MLSNRIENELVNYHACKLRLKKKYEKELNNILACTGNNVCVCDRIVELNERIRELNAIQDQLFFNKIKAIVEGGENGDI